MSGHIICPLRRKCFYPTSTHPAFTNTTNNSRNSSSSSASPSVSASSGSRPAISGAAYASPGSQRIRFAVHKQASACPSPRSMKAKRFGATRTSSAPAPKRLGKFFPGPFLFRQRQLLAAPRFSNERSRTLPQGCGVGQVCPVPCGTPAQAHPPRSDPDDRAEPTPSRKSSPADRRP